ncbi:hypothetical protein DPMN_155906 [Dreissena polymorpha]|uniref:Uncharacterized protein n=1 Tax=Dreissena polymorpha TaxID=45954 RepID=A0A9D4JBC7_DREPO|nr:hypothetical protein DPMN_155906 [Dreissena polymorpha]
MSPTNQPIPSQSSRLPTKPTKEISSAIRAVCTHKTKQYAQVQPSSLPKPM